MQLYEGTIITCDSRDRVARFLLEENGRIVLVSDQDPTSLGFPGADRAQRVLLQQRALAPAFADTHIHFCSWSFFLSRVDVRGCGSNREMAELLAEAARSNPDSAPILAFGASAHVVSERKLISRTDLDRTLPKQGVMVFKYDGHACTCNTAMLRLLPEGIRGERGFHEASGELEQEAFFAASAFVTRRISPLSLLQGMLKGYETLASRGIGMIHSSEGVGFPRDLDVTMALLVARGVKMPVRTRLFFQTMDVERVRRRRLPRIGGCFATALDGSFGSGDAALQEPYASPLHGRGVLYYEQQRVNEFCRRANRAGLQIAMHAIGDAAISQAITALEAALADSPREDHRHIIIHACLAAPWHLERCAELGISIAAQSSFVHWPEEPDWYLRSLLGDRAERLTPLRSMRRAGVHVSLGSDAPCTAPNPMLWLHNACNHPCSDESVSVQEALTMMTREAAWMSFDERETGSLEPGKAADMVILSRNPLTSRISELKNIAVEALLLNGRRLTGAGTVPGLLLRALGHR